METIVYGNHYEWYDVINAFSMVMCEIVILLFCNRLYALSTFPKIFKSYIDKNKNMLTFAKGFTYMLCILSLFIITSCNDKAAPKISEVFLGSPDDNYFVYIFLLPILAYVFAVLLKIKPSLFSDCVCACGAVCLICFKIACALAGCCYGVEYNGRFYNEGMNEYQVPVQLIELACAVVMFAVIMLLIKNKKMQGKVFPLFMIMYCSSRFVSEFWRADYPAVYGRMTGYHIQCIIGFALGVIYMIIAVLFGKKLDAYFQKKNDAFALKFVENLPDWKMRHPNLWVIVKFQVAGIIASGVEIIIHLLLLNIILYKCSQTMIHNPLLISIGIKSVGYFWSFAISTAVGYSFGFFFGRKLVFNSQANQVRSMIKYAIMVIFTIFACGWIGTVMELYAQRIGFTGTIEDVIVKFISMNIPFIWTYPLNKYFVHRDLIKR